MVRICVEEWGFPVVKLNPAQNEYPIDSPSWCTWWTGSSRLAPFRRSILERIRVHPAEGLRAVAMRHPDWPVIGIHMGAVDPPLLRPNLFTWQPGRWD